MKKIILALIVCLFTFYQNVQAEECNSWEIEDANEALKDLTFNIAYNDKYEDMNGDFQEGYFQITFQNLPEEYSVRIYKDEKFNTISNINDSISLSGGVYKVQVYYNSCDSIMKSFEIKIPFYKYYCRLENMCNEDTWFDGTYPTVNDNKEEKNNNKNLRLTLIIVLSLLIILLAIIIFTIIKRRHKDENNF